ncbi:hypothetical protein EVAR_55672_1 [Eumeta japonica]|uniref:Uncharacterized protein n=1 Tax=Eumeta variegata TaxID=151549 RepID=A0A4C1ZW87_EUMVA|nr:hypothetical protein EVAR_55672_1 [Eumeta japonica]
MGGLEVRRESSEKSLLSVIVQTTELSLRCIRHVICDGFGNASVLENNKKRAEIQINSFLFVIFFTPISRLRVHTVRSDNAYSAGPIAARACAGPSRIAGQVCFVRSIVGCACELLMSDDDHDN